MIRAFQYLGRILLIASVIAGTGAQWSALQSVAWTGMLAENLRNHSLADALTITFDGKHPCCLCRVIANAEKSGRKPTATAPSRKLEFPPASTQFQLFASDPMLPAAAPLIAFRSLTLPRPRLLRGFNWCSPTESVTARFVRAVFPICANATALCATFNRVTNLSLMISLALRKCARPFALAAVLIAPQTLIAHGFAGNRFFPATLATDDPFVADELSLPTVSFVRLPDGARELDVSTDIAKRITPRLQLEIGETFTRIEPRDGHSANGFQNLEAGVKFQLWKNEPHETILSVGLNAEIGGTGREAVGAEDSSVITPAIFIGRGLGDLPERLELAEADGHHRPGRRCPANQRRVRLFR